VADVYPRDYSVIEVSFEREPGGGRKEMWDTETRGKEAKIITKFLEGIGLQVEGSFGRIFAK